MVELAPEKVSPPVLAMFQKVKAPAIGSDTVLVPSVIARVPPTLELNVAADTAKFAVTNVPRLTLNVRGLKTSASVYVPPGAEIVWLEPEGKDRPALVIVSPAVRPARVRTTPQVTDPIPVRSRLP